MKKTITILTFLSLLLTIWAALLWLLPSAADTTNTNKTRYGLNEGLELVELNNGATGKHYVVDDANGNELFTIPLRNCMLDTRYRNGQLRFRELATRREGFIDRDGIVTFTTTAAESILPKDMQTAATIAQASNEANSGNNAYQKASASIGKGAQSIPTVSLQKIAKDNPFYKEAAKVLAGKLSVEDTKNRKMILNYCEHFRTAYTTKDIPFLRQVFSDKALIIVGNMVKPAADNGKCQAGGSRVTYAIHSKRNYLLRLSKVFNMNKNVDVRFSDFRIMRHPTMDGIYGVTLRQQYKSDRYSDDGYLFLLWDFRDKTMPLIHVRTWQPAEAIHDTNEIINIQDFNLE